MERPVSRRYIRGDQANAVTHEQSPEDNPHDPFRKTLCDKAIPDHRGWSSGPITARNPITCPDCIEAAS